MGHALDEGFHVDGAIGVITSTVEKLLQSGRQAVVLVLERGECLFHAGLGENGAAIPALNDRASAGNSVDPGLGTSARKPI